MGLNQFGKESRKSIKEKVFPVSLGFSRLRLKRLRPLLDRLFNGSFWGSEGFQIDRSGELALAQNSLRIQRTIHVSF
jgi:hypothetical protein